MEFNPEPEIGTGGWGQLEFTSSIKRKDVVIWEEELQMKYL